jgi:eukaryotic-like serine/threonine-protein kinase
MTQPKQPENLGKYHNLKEIGRGGFATVYRAEDTNLGREVALKILDPLLLRDAAWVDHFRREARAVARLKHPHVITIYDVLQSEGQLFIVMDLVEGLSLDRYLAQQGPLPWPQALTILQQVAGALDYAHQQDVIHRDLKPANILLDPHRGAILTDFGFARSISANSVSLSISGGIVGTPSYIAPEVWQDKPVSPATDVYALACIVPELLTGKVLFQGSTPAAVMTQHIMEGPRLPESWPKGVPAGIGSTLRRALDPDPDRRPPSAGELVDVLSKAPSIRQQAAPRVKPQRSAGASRADKPTPRPDRLPWLLPAAGAGAVGLLVVLGLVLTVILRRVPQGSSRPPTAIHGTAVASVPSTVAQTPTAAETAIAADPSESGPATPAVVPWTPTYTPTPTPTPVTWVRPIDDMAMVYVPEGEFLMGSPAGEGADDEHPQHEVYLDAFWIDRYEVSNSQYQLCVEAGACKPSQYAGDSKFDGADQPVVGVDWEDASSYCGWIGAQLPTEAQWEKAARGEEGWTYPWGNEPATCDYAVMDDGGSGCGKNSTWDVGSKPAGASVYGAMDMAGNVWEWVADWYDGTYYKDAPERNPTGPSSGTARVLRGGSWNYNVLDVRAANRYNNPDNGSNNVGCRCARSSE